MKINSHIRVQNGDTKNTARLGLTRQIYLCEAIETANLSFILFFYIMVEKVRWLGVDGHLQVHRF